MPVLVLTDGRRVTVAHNDAARIEEIRQGREPAGVTDKHKELAKHIDHIVWDKLKTRSTNGASTITCPCKHCVAKREHGACACAECTSRKRVL